MSSDPNDLSALTPAHFIIGESLLFPAEYCYRDVADNKLFQWQHAQRVRQHFWNRWHQEYLNELQKRLKWRTKGNDLENNRMILIVKDNLPLLCWILVRIDKIHPGVDGVVRATVKMSTSL